MLELRPTARDGRGPAHDGRAHVEVARLLGRPYKNTGPGANQNFKVVPLKAIFPVGP